MSEEHRNRPVSELAEGLCIFLTEEGLTEANRERIHFLLLSCYQQGMKDGLEMAKVLSGQHVYSKRRPPYAEDPTAAYDN